MRVYFSLLIIIIAGAVMFSQPIRGVYYHAFSNTLVLSVEGAATWEQTDYSGNTFDYLGKVALEYFLPSDREHLLDCEHLELPDLFRVKTTNRE